MRPTLSVDRFFLSWVLASSQDGSEQIGKKKSRAKFIHPLRTNLTGEWKFQQERWNRRSTNRETLEVLHFQVFSTLRGVYLKGRKHHSSTPGPGDRSLIFVRSQMLSKPPCLLPSKPFSAFLCLLAVMLGQVLLAAEAADLVNGEGGGLTLTSLQEVLSLPPWRTTGSLLSS